LAVKVQGGVEFVGRQLPPIAGNNVIVLAKPDPIKLDFGGHYKVGTICFRRNTDGNSSVFGTDFEEIPLAKFPGQRI